MQNTVVVGVRCCRANSQFVFTVTVCQGQVVDVDLPALL